jgi:hypothetical protein
MRMKPYLPAIIFCSIFAAILLVVFIVRMREGDSDEGQETDKEQ